MGLWWLVGSCGGGKSAISVGEVVGGIVVVGGVVGWRGSAASGCGGVVLGCWGGAGR